MTPLPSEDAAFALGDALERRRLKPRDSAAATSLLNAWSEERGWTMRQARMVNALLATARKAARQAFGTTVNLPAATGKEAAEWWHDTSPERQALRGMKSGTARRWESRERDKAIERHLRTRKHTRAELAAHHGISTRQVTRIAKRIATGLVDISRRTVAPVTSLLVKNVKAFLSRSKGGDTNPCRSDSEDGCTARKDAEQAEQEVINVQDRQWNSILRDFECDPKPKCPIPSHDIEYRQAVSA